MRTIYDIFDSSNAAQKMPHQIWKNPKNVCLDSQQNRSNLTYFQGFPSHWNHFLFSGVRTSISAICHFDFKFVSNLTAHNENNNCPHFPTLRKTRVWGLLFPPQVPPFWIYFPPLIAIYQSDQPTDSTRSVLLMYRRGGSDHISENGSRFSVFHLEQIPKRRGKNMDARRQFLLLSSEFFGGSHICFMNVL